ncbi:thiosulfate sulfurtransferase GlpE [Geobacter sp. OR-1]|uniref:rhodanese-like domain-containing protein n=1 Tax=Geobacter sp. OR-1 TaxID=1266765 RepID=UPI0005438E0D|nr:rhodanese-like domain-containing protein [Geobacter sp. OR-1]GAM09324.1 thiosulfate sulfurtransferase GlpE [Geobacter sp. OR-1]
MLSSNTNWRKLIIALTAAGVLAATPLLAADGAPAGSIDGKNTKVCSTCHRVEAGTYRGYFENVSMKSLSLQVKVDEKSEIIKFDKGTIKVSNPDVKDADVEKQLRGIKKNHEVKVVVELKNGALFAKAIVAKPPIKVDEAKLIKIDDVERLVALGPEKGNFTLIDSRPFPRYQDGFIPGAINLPYPAFDKNIDKLPADKNRLIVFYCAGITCTMSPKSLEKAEQLGYRNAKVFREGMPGWLQRKPGVMTVKFIKEAWLDKEMPFVLLDTRSPKEAEKGFIKNAVTFPVVDEKSLKTLPKKAVKAPIFVYDADGKGNSQAVAQGIVKAGYAPVLVVDGGIAAWQKAGLPVENGALATKIAYIPKPKAGEISIDNFKTLIAAIPADTILIDVRPPDEVKEGAIAGAVNIPTTEIDQRLAQLPKEKRIVAYCNSGTLAEMAYHTLKGKGYPSVFFLNAKVEIDEGKVEISR